MQSVPLRIAALVACLATVAATQMSQIDDTPALLQKRAIEDSYKIFLRKRHAHACMMSIVFIVIFPLGAISHHLPLNGVVRRVVTRVHAPIQILGLAMMIGAMGLGIDIARNDLHYITPVHAHVVIGLLTTSLVILIQPALGILQHLHFKKTQQKSLFGQVHRWSGRGLIVLGWINSCLGFQLTGGAFVPLHARVRNFVLMGVLGGLWFLLVGIDGLRSHWLKRQKLGAFGPGWKRGFTFRESGEEKADGSPSQ